MEAAGPIGLLPTASRRSARRRAPRRRKNALPARPPTSPLGPDRAEDRVCSGFL